MVFGTYPQGEISESRGRHFVLEPDKKYVVRAGEHAVIMPRMAYGREAVQKIWKFTVRRHKLSEKKTCPEHVAIILDGNGRWARQRGHERTYGHGFGAANVKKIISAAGEMGIKVVTLYAFSTENWKRPKTEVQFLLKLFF